MVDVFAGPGGLNEGFSSLVDDRGVPLFQTVGSFEMDQVACQTLRLRAALRHHRRQHGSHPDVYYRFLRGETDIESLRAHTDLEVAFKESEAEVQEMALGPATRTDSSARITEMLHRSSQHYEPWILIGGPPCQAYSIAGRSRRRSDPTFADDEKHVLYREYLEIIRSFRPTVFVMENVKGMLSSQHAGDAIFRRILDDLRSPAPGVQYDVHSFVVPGDDPSPTDFIIRAERFGVPQKRHRVILLGVLRGMGLPTPAALSVQDTVTVRDVIEDLPAIRSKISPRRSDDPDLWSRAREEAWRAAGLEVASQLRVPPVVDERYLPGYESRIQGALATWLTDSAIQGVTLHQSRAHMVSDLHRYGYLSVMAGRGIRPKLHDLPPGLLPNHRNATRADAPFIDRFRVQGWAEPSTTVVSHISKDGHYYIHPDPLQVRSLTVREVARLQTFPDDYFFLGSRTQQYHQVGNAVPPHLARQLGRVVAGLFGRDVGVGRI